MGTAGIPAVRAQISRYLFCAVSFSHCPRRRLACSFGALCCARGKLLCSRCLCVFFSGSVVSHVDFPSRAPPRRFVFRPVVTSPLRVSSGRVPSRLFSCSIEYRESQHVRTLCGRSDASWRPGRLGAQRCCTAFRSVRSTGPEQVSTTSCEEVEVVVGRGMAWRGGLAWCLEGTGADFLCPRKKSGLIL